MHQLGVDGCYQLLRIEVELPRIPGVGNNRLKIYYWRFLIFFQFAILPIAMLTKTKVWSIDKDANLVD